MYCSLCLVSIHIVIVSLSGFNVVIECLNQDICKVSLEKVKLQLAEGLLASSCENYRVWTMYWEKIEGGIILRKLEEQLCSQSADVLE